MLALDEPTGNPGLSQQNDGGKEDPNRRKSNVRKRTKTGCLTCRRRRIKCDEGRPVCNNCVKSKRRCEGYNQRVIFKEPIGSLQGPFNPAVFPPGSSHLIDDSLATQQGKQPSRVPLQAIAPRPPAFDFRQHHGLPLQHESVPYQSHFHPEQIYEKPLTYGLNQNQLFPPTYSQLPNPLLASEISSGPAQYDAGSDFQYFGPEDDNAGEGPSNSHRLNNAVALNPQPSSLSRPVDNEWEYDVPDDDASMPDSDDDLPDARGLVAPVANMLSGAWGRNATEVRTFSAFAQSSAVLAYMDAPHSSEFWNSGLSTIFMHFVNVTGPSISLYERHPFNPAEQERFGADHKSGHSLWSYTFPVLALRHPGLLHAMLALASLQLAKLQDSPPTAALKHYHRSIRRIAKNVRSPLRRTQPATLAATLLLGYFEVWSSDHTKWCNHLFGARILFREIPLREMTRICLPVKRMRERQKQEQRHHISSFPGLNTTSTGPEADTTALDYEFLSAITGFNVVPEDYGVGAGQILDERCFSATDNDLEKYDTLCDLFWWYCKMDVYQSVLGGTKLFMEYECWTQCPPRASASKFGAIYGTYDHLMLLLGRLANFASKDLSRKRKAAKSQGGNVGGGSPPMFPGMLPTHGTVHVPMGFSPPRDTTPQSDLNEDLDPHASYDAALQEWNGLLQAFQVFERHLGNEFKPLGPEYADRRESPFGVAVQFRTFSIAGIWMNYYMGLIHLHRSHPSMPPAAMRAAGLTAHKTRAYAIQIGRIAAGLSVDCSQFTEITTYLGAAFIESSFCLFVAGVQYQDAAQRHWIVQRMHDIARLTGWQSARQIADGCESAWIKAEQMGGPPYVRPSTINNVPLSIWQNPRRIDRRIHELDHSEERRLVLAKAERAHYALGLLGVEEDLEVLELRDDPT